MKRLTPVTDEYTVSTQAPLAKSKKEPIHPKYYTTTLFNEDGTYVDDGKVSRKEERTYFEAFVDSTCARELERRLAIVEAPEYIQGSRTWEDMNGETNEDPHSERSDGESPAFQCSDAD